MTTTSGSVREVEFVKVGSIKVHPDLPIVTVEDERVIEKLREEIVAGTAEIPPIHVTPGGLVLVNTRWFRAVERAGQEEVGAWLFPDLENDRAAQLAHMAKFEEASDRLSEPARLALALLYWDELAVKANENQKLQGPISAAKREGKDVPEVEIESTHARRDAARAFGICEDSLRKGRKLRDAQKDWLAPVFVLFEQGIMALGVAFDIYEGGLPAEKQKKLVEYILSFQKVDDQRAEARSGPAWRYIEDHLNVERDPKVRRRGRVSLSPQAKRLPLTLRKRVHAVADRFHKAVLSLAFLKKLPRDQQSEVYGLLLERLDADYHRAFARETAREKAAHSKAKDAYKTAS